MERKELVEEARKRFPIGAKVQSTAGFIAKVIGFAAENFCHEDGWDKKEEGQIWFAGDNYNLIVYNKGIWAELLTPPKKSKQKIEYEIY